MLKNRYIYLLVFLVMGLVGPSVQAQCDKVVWESLEKYSLESSLGSGEVFEYDMTLKISPIQETKGVQTRSHINMIVGRNLYVNTSEQVAIYADSVQLFSVLKPSRTVVWQDMQKKAMNGAMPKDLLKYIDSSTCSTVTVGAVSYTKILCTLQKDFADEQLLGKVEYWVDLQAQRLYKAKVYYQEKSGLKYIEMDYHRIRKMPCPVHLQGDVRALFLEKNSKKLKAKYKGFRLQDRRQVQK